MATASVMLKEGLSYTYPHGGRDYKFTPTPQTVSGEEFITALESISVLAVERHKDKPVTPLKAVKPAPKAAAKPAPEPEVEEELADDEEQAEEPTDDEEPVEDEEVLEEPAEDVEPEPEPEPAPAPKAKGGNKNKPAKGGKKG